MSRKLKVLGLAMAAVLAVSAVTASAASATNRFFHAASVPVVITGGQTTPHDFTTEAGTVTCKVATFSGKQTVLTSKEITLTPKYENCIAFGFISVPIDVNGCSYLFTSETTTVVGGVAVQDKPIAHLECPTGKKIEITAPGCTTSIGPQTLLGMSFANNAGKTDVTATAHIAGIEYNECGNIRHNGTFSSTTTLTGATESGTAVSIWYE